MNGKTQHMNVHKGQNAKNECYILAKHKMNVHIGQKTKNEQLYRPNIQKMNVYIGTQNTKNERLYRPKHKK